MQFYGSFFLQCIALGGLIFCRQSGAFKHGPNRIFMSQGLDRQTTRREFTAAGSLSIPISLLGLSSIATAADARVPSSILVAGATGATGKRVVSLLAQRDGINVIAGVRSVSKAKEKLSGFQNIQYRRLDVEEDDTKQLAEVLKGVDAVICAIGFVPSNPLQMNKKARAVDNEGTCKLVDASKIAGVENFVLISSILTDARSWGQENSPGFKVTNAFGNVLDEKIVAERKLMTSSVDYTIVRPGGLKASKPSGGLVVSNENTLNSGEISRDLVADVCVAALFDEKSSNRVVEIIEDDKKPKLAYEKYFE